MNDLVTSSNSVAIQAFPLTEGKVNIGSGIFANAIGFHCVEDGTVEITWPSGIETITCVQTDDYMVTGHSQIEVKTGTFHII